MPRTRRTSTTPAANPAASLFETPKPAEPKPAMTMSAALRQRVLASATGFQSKSTPAALAAQVEKSIAEGNSQRFVLRQGSMGQSGLNVIMLVTDKPDATKKVFLETTGGFAGRTMYGPVDLI